MKAWAEIALNAGFCVLCFGTWNTTTYAADIIAVAKEIIVLLLT